MPAQLAVAVELEHAGGQDRGVARGGEQPAVVLERDVGDLARGLDGGDVGPARGEDPVELARDDAAGQPLAESDHEDVRAAEGIGQALFRLAREKSHPLEA